MHFHSLKMGRSKPQTTSSSSGPHQAGASTSQRAAWQAVSRGRLVGRANGQAARILAFTCLLAVSSVRTYGQERAELDLAGEWQLRCDPDDVGTEERWFEQTLPETVQLPGSIQSQGFGQPPSGDTHWTGTIRQDVLEMPRYEPYRQPGNFKMPFWLQPKRCYLGAAWFQRRVTIPAEWSGKQVWLSLERPHWCTEVWFDNHAIGSCDSLSTPHEYDLTRFASPGEHLLTLRVDNRLHIDVGENSHSVTDHTQTNWNGVVGKLTLQATDQIWIDDVQVIPNWKQRTALVHVTIGNSTGRSSDVQLQLRASCGDHCSAPVETRLPITDTSTRTTLKLPLGEQMQSWDEHAPNLYDLVVTMKGPQRDTFAVKFGVRDISVRNKRFMLNDRPVYFRGTLECCIFPLTGYPPMNASAWKRVIGTCKAFGLNHMRFHSWCPPEAAFAAADELGFYFQIECASWANAGASVGDGKPLDDWLYREADRILAAYGNHPSFLLFAYGNEPAGPGPHHMGEDYLTKWVDHFKQRSRRQLVTAAAGWPYIQPNEFHVMHHPLRQHGEFNRNSPSTNRDYRQPVQDRSVPLISHETGQWCVFPDLKEMTKYTGVVQPKNFEIVRDFLQAHGLLHQAEDFLTASGQFQKLLYKEEIEIMLRTPGLGGFQLLDLHDFPGQGTALVGVLDPFWSPKPYVSASEFRSFSGPVVPLARLDRRIWTKDETLVAEIEVAQFGQEDLSDQVVQWKLYDQQQQRIGEGSWREVDLPAGDLHSVGRLEFPLRTADCPNQLTLTVSIEGSPYRNQWDLWVYDSMVQNEEGIAITDKADEAMRLLHEEKKVLFLPPIAAIAGDTFGSFEPIFWNRLWFPNQKPHTLGILCDPEHPALKQFPTDSHCNWQWWDLCNHSKPVVMDELPSQLFPLVQAIDDWNTCRKLGLLFEARVGRGSLLFSAIDLRSNLEQRPAARQLRRSLVHYMQSDAFAPKIEVSIRNIRSLLRPLSNLEKLSATIRADSQQSGYEAQNAIDNNPETIWHTAWGASETPHPHELILDLKSRQRVAGLSYLPRQDMANGRIAEYAVYSSLDGHEWGEPLATGRWEDGRTQQTIRFSSTVTARFIKLTCLSEVNNKSFAAAAEIDLLLP
jgi:hypothetical protein